MKYLLCSVFIGLHLVGMESNSIPSLKSNKDDVIPFIFETDTKSTTSSILLTQLVILQSNDGHIFNITYELARHSKTICNIIDDYDLEDLNKIPIPLDLNHEKLAPIIQLLVECNSENKEDVTEFLNALDETDLLIDVLESCNYLDIPIKINRIYDIKIEDKSYKLQQSKISEEYLKYKLTTKAKNNGSLFLNSRLLVCYKDFIDIIKKDFNDHIAQKVNENFSTYQGLKIISNDTQEFIIPISLLQYSETLKECYEQGSCAHINADKNVVTCCLKLLYACDYPWLYKLNEILRPFEDTISFFEFIELAEALKLPLDKFLDEGYSKDKDGFFKYLIKEIPLIELKKRNFYCILQKQLHNNFVIWKSTCEKYIMFQESDSTYCLWNLKTRQPSTIQLSKNPRNTRNQPFTLLFNQNNNTATLYKKNGKIKTSFEQIPLDIITNQEFTFGAYPHDIIITISNPYHKKRIFNVNTQSFLLIKAATLSSLSSIKAVQCLTRDEIYDNRMQDSSIRILDWDIICKENNNNVLGRNMSRLAFINNDSYLIGQSDENRTLFVWDLSHFGSVLKEMPKLLKTLKKLSFAQNYLVKRILCKLMQGPLVMQGDYKKIYNDIINTIEKECGKKISVLVDQYLEKHYVIPQQSLWSNILSYYDV